MSEELKTIVEKHNYEIINHGGGMVHVKDKKNKELFIWLSAMWKLTARNVDRYWYRAGIAKVFEAEHPVVDDNGFKDLLDNGFFM